MSEIYVLLCKMNERVSMLAKMILNNIISNDLLYENILHVSRMLLINTNKFSLGNYVMDCLLHLANVYVMLCRMKGRSLMPTKTIMTNINTNSSNTLCMFSFSSVVYCL